jgi:error-prone DNA polymerase
LRELEAMPEPSSIKRAPKPASFRLADDKEPGRVRYAELHCRTNFSFLEGASHAEELVERAGELGQAALAITDRNSLAGVVRAHVAARQAGLKLVIGAEVTPVDAVPVLLWAADRQAYGRLARLLTLGRRSAPKGECHLRFDDVADLAAGLLAGVLARHAAIEKVQPYRDLFADRCYLVGELHRGAQDSRLLERFVRISKKACVPLIAANDVHYHVRERQPLQDVLSAVRLGCTVAELGKHRFANGERHLKTPAEMIELFAEYPEAVARTLEVSERCTFSLDELRYEYPEELCPPGTTPLQYLTRLTEEGARQRFPAGVPGKVRALLDHELKLIAELRYEAYFLTVWDLVRFARGRDILCQGRGSAANSAVCYCLGITSVDPDRIDVLFERFVSKERDEAPDIDVDFEHERREEVLQYLFGKYGRERAGMTAEVITYRPRSAIRDVGNALGLSLDRVDVLAKTLGHHDHEVGQLAQRFTEAGVDPQSLVGRQLMELVGQLVGFPRHLSQHVGGMVITRGPLSELVPIENAAMPERTVVQWDKDDLDALGILKVDILALGMLTAIRKCFDLIAGHYQANPSVAKLTLATVPPEDPAIYAMMSRADTIGVFQIESRAQMSMLPRLRPCCFYDLVIEVALVRPGPIQGDMVHPYLRRRSGQERIDYPDERVRGVLEKTLGVPLFQEQAMKLAVVAAGFTPGEADQLRRAMGAWRRRGIMEPFQRKFVQGMKANGYSEQFAERVFRMIQGFGDYGFPESHAASFAHLVYVSAWLKCYYPAAFAAALLNSQPMGFYAPAQIVADVRKHSVDVRPIDVNFSHWHCTLEPETAGTAPCALRLGFRLIHGLGERHTGVVASERDKRLYGSFEDFVGRTRLPRKALLTLAQASAFGSLGLTRRHALWLATPRRERLPLFDYAEEEVPASLSLMTPFQETLADYGAAGLTLREHPMHFLRPYLDLLEVVSAADLKTLPVDSLVKIAGVVLLRQRPSTAKGVTFVTLEDETGMANLIVWPNVWECYRRIAFTATTMLAHGSLQREADVIHVVVGELEDLSARLAALETRPRDFR